MASARKIISFLPPLLPPPAQKKRRNKMTEQREKEDKNQTIFLKTNKQKTHRYHNKNSQKNSINSSEKYQLCRQNIEKTNKLFFATRSQHFCNTFAIDCNTFATFSHFFAALSQQFRNTLSTRSRYCRRNSHQATIDPSSLFPMHQVAMCGTLFSGGGEAVRV